MKPFTSNPMSTTEFGAGVVADHARTSLCRSRSSARWTPHRLLALACALAGLIGLSACGSEDGPSTSAATDVTVAQTKAEVEVENGSADDHGDEDEHDAASEEDHGDDGDDESHDDDESHGDDHDDEHDHDDESSSGLGAHEHGAAELSVAWIDGDVAIDLISPLFNIFGFEYEPTTDEDRAIADDRMAALSGAGIITVNNDAQCSLSEPITTEIERDGSHSEMTASWLFTCDEPGEIAEVDATGLFTEFPNFEDIDAQWISSTDQAAGELTPSSPTLRLR